MYKKIISIMSVVLVVFLCFHQPVYAYSSAAYRYYEYNKSFNTGMSGNQQDQLRVMIATTSMYADLDYINAIFGTGSGAVYTSSEKEYYSVLVTLRLYNRSDHPLKNTTSYYGIVVSPANSQKYDLISVRQLAGDMMYGGMGTDACLYIYPEKYSEDLNFYYQPGGAKYCTFEMIFAAYDPIDSTDENLVPPQFNATSCFMKWPTDASFSYIVDDDLSLPYYSYIPDIHSILDTIASTDSNTYLQVLNMLAQLQSINGNTDQVEQLINNVLSQLDSMYNTEVDMSGDIYLLRQYVYQILQSYNTNIPASQDVSSDAGSASTTIGNQHQQETSIYNQTNQAIGSTGIQNFQFDSQTIGGLGGIKNDFMLVWNSLGTFNTIFVSSLTIGLALSIVRHRRMFRQ